MSQFGYTGVPTNSWQEFETAVNGNGYNTDGYYGDQCWDGADLFWRNAVGRGFSTGGTGYARGAWEAARNVNAGGDFDLTTDKSSIQPGDWLVFGGSLGGHVGMAVSGNLGNYVRLLAQNQSGSNVDAGYPFTEINFSLNNMLGIFRYKKWHIAPVPTKSIDDVAHEVLSGLWGNGTDRVARLQAAGYDSTAVQNAVNALLAGSQPVNNPQKSIDQLAQEVMDGDWGNGDDRKARLAAAGYDYNAVQARVNELENQAPAAPAGPQVGDTVRTSATTDQNGAELNLGVINDGQSVFAEVNSKGNAVLTKGGVVRAAVPVDSLSKA